MANLIRFIAIGVLVVVRLFAVESDLLPSAIERCLELPSIRQRAVIVQTVNPFYLRGDFDGDGKPDYAVTVKGKHSGKLRVVMCMTNNRAFLLGSENG